MLAGVVLALLGRLFDYAARKDLRSKWHWILAQRKGDYDFAVMGPSRAYMGVDVTSLETKLGQRGINLALDGAGAADQLLALRMFLKHNKLRHLLLDVNLNALDKRGLTYSFHDYEYLPFSDDPDVDAGIAKQRGAKAWAWKYVPFWRNAEFNAQIGPIQLYTFLKASQDPKARIPEFDAKGSRLVSGPFVSRAQNRPETWAIEPELVAEFRELLVFAREKGVTITLTLTPELRSRTALQANRAELLATYQKLADDFRLKFLKFDDLPLVDDTRYFVDPSHLNADGARQYTEALAASLRTP